MHHAPPVSYPVGRSRTVIAAAIAVSATGLGATLAWSLHGELAGLRLLAAPGALLVGAWALAHALRAATGELRWDGGGWRWSRAGEAPGHLSVALDFQRQMLLRWQAADARPHWLWLERRRFPARWDDLRRAVYSRANPDALPGAEPPAANP